MYGNPWFRPRSLLAWATVAYRRHVPGQGKDWGGKPWRSYFRGGQITSAFAPTTPTWRVLMPQTSSSTAEVSPLALALTGYSSAQGRGTTRWRTATAVPWSTRAKYIRTLRASGYMRLTVTAISQQTVSCLPRE